MLANQYLATISMLSGRSECKLHGFCVLRDDLLNRCLALVRVPLGRGLSQTVASYEFVFDRIGFQLVR